MAAVDFGVNRFHGPVNMTQLPATLGEIYIDGNAFSGPLIFNNSPADLYVINASSNLFSGGFDLSTVPASVYMLEVASNQFTGRLHFADLGSNIDWANFSCNKFSGELDLSQLPPFLDTLAFSHNMFSGQFIFSNPPIQLGQIYASNNRFSGLLDLSQIGAANVIEGGINFLDLRNNSFEGTVDMTPLSQGGVSVPLQGNPSLYAAVCAVGPNANDTQCLEAFDATTLVLNTTVYVHGTFAVPAGMYVHNTESPTFLTVTNSSASIGSCTWSPSAAPISYSDDWGFVFSSPSFMNVMAPCFSLPQNHPFEFATYVDTVITFVSKNAANNAAFKFIHD